MGFSASLNAAAESNEGEREGEERSRNYQTKQVPHLLPFQALPAGPFAQVEPVTARLLLQPDPKCVKMALRSGRPALRKR